MTRLAVATSAYWLAALAFGFAFGAVREIALTPSVGPVWATLVELPLILAALWWACRWIISRTGLPPGAVRATMGALWLMCLLAAEFALGALLRGWSAADSVGHFRTAPGAIGLAGFIAAALFPSLVRR